MDTNDADQNRTTKTDNQTSAPTTNRISKNVKINYACMCVFAFLMGADFAVIIPTLWDRLSIDMKTTGAFMGLVISSFSATGVIAGLVMGHISDLVNKTKIFFLISFLFAILGHLIYFVGINKYLILAGRSISGVCMGAGTVALAYIAKTTDDSQRTSVISIIMASRQFGLMLGPAFNLFLRKLNFVLFDLFVVDKKSSPGLFMALLWSISFVAFLVIYKEEPSKKPVENDEEKKFITSESTNLTRTEKQKEFFKLEIFVLLAITFFTYFNQTSLETCVTPFTEIMFGWSELENSFLFCVGGCIIIASYVVIRLLSLKFPDRFILMCGLVCIFLGLVVGIVCLPFAKQLQNPEKFQLSLYKKNYKKLDSILNNTLDESNSTVQVNLEDYMFNESILNISMDINKIKKIVLTSNDTSLFIQKPVYDYQFFPAFVIFVILDVLGLPAIAITSASLFTKLISNKVQGLGQGIQRGVLGIGTIVGPLCTGPFVKRPIYIIGISLSFIALIIVLAIISYRKLMPAKKEQAS